jgi:hypothetical protein
MFSDAQKPWGFCGWHSNENTSFGVGFNCLQNTVNLDFRAGKSMQAQHDFICALRWFFRKINSNCQFLFVPRESIKLFFGLI